MAIKDILNSWLESRVPGMSLEDITFDTYHKMKSDLSRNGLPDFSIPTYKVPSLQSAVYRDQEYNPVSLYINPNDMVIASHELGHIADFKKNKNNVNIYKFLEKLPILHNVSPLLREYNANKTSWDLLKNTYKDDPELLKHFGDLRSNILPKAYATYVSTHGAPLAGAIGTGALGAWLGSKIIGSDEDYILDDLLPEEKKKKKKRRRKVNKIIGMLAGGSAGAILGDSLGNGVGKYLLPKAMNNLQTTINSSEYTTSLKNLNNMIKNFKKNS